MMPPDLQSALCYQYTVLHCSARVNVCSDKQALFHSLR